MAACVRLAMALLSAIGSAVLVLYGDLALRIYITRTTTTLKVVSIDPELQHHSTKVVSE